MSDETLPYDKLVEAAMRNVLRETLLLVTEHGLPGDHHLYIGFDTNDPGVHMSPVQRSKYPDEMTIVLQHRFWNLEVGEEAFSVDLTFDGRRESLTIPFVAVTRFVDPSVNFGLQFQDAPDTEISPPPTGAGNSDDAAKDTEEDTEEAARGGDQNVVSLDTFRDKT